MIAASPRDADGLWSTAAMVITDPFVFVHQPKTGGTFVRQVIDTVSQAEVEGFPLGRLRRAGLLPRRYRYRDTGDYHDTCHDIPAADRHKQIVSAVRNPFDFYVSFYHFGWWAAHPEDSYRDFDAVKRAFPNFPELSFAEFLQLANRFFRDFEDIGDSGEDHHLGYYSVQFLLYFFTCPAEAYRRIDAAYLARGGWADDMFPVHFMRTENLNRDLHQFLRGAGYPAHAIDPMLAKAPVRPSELFTPRPSARFKDYYTPATYDYVRHKERLLLAMFPDLGGDQSFESWIAG